MPVVKLAGLAAALVLGSAASHAADPPLRLCADPANLPFSSQAPEAAAKGAPGLYVEIGQAIAEGLERPMETVWSLTYFGKRNLRATLLAGQCDFAVGLPAVKDFMGPRVIFTRPILTLGYAMVLPKGLTVRSVEDLKGRRVVVQFASPPQSLLASRNDITLVTAMDPEEAMRRLGAGEADAAFIWGPSAGYLNHVSLNDRFDVVPVEAPQMQFEAAVGVSNKNAALRDQIDAILPLLAMKIRALTAKYALALGPALVLSQARPMRLASADNAAMPEAERSPTSLAPDAADPVQGRVTFNGTCAHCHGPDAVVGDRKIDLRRLHQKYAADMDSVFLTTVTEGRPAKGMPTWKNVFSQQDFANILAYLKTVQNK